MKIRMFFIALLVGFNGSVQAAYSHFGTSGGLQVIDAFNDDLGVYGAALNMRGAVYDTTTGSLTGDASILDMPGLVGPTVLSSISLGQFLGWNGAFEAIAGPATGDASMVGSLGAWIEIENPNAYAVTLALSINGIVNAETSGQATANGWIESYANIGSGNFFDDLIAGADPLGPLSPYSSPNSEYSIAIFGGGGFGPPNVDAGGLNPITPFTLDPSQKAVIGLYSRVNIQALATGTVVPVPASAWLFASAIAALIGYRKKHC